MNAEKEVALSEDLIEEAREHLKDEMREAMDCKSQQAQLEDINQKIATLEGQVLSEEQIQTMTLEETDAQCRWGRVVVRWGDIKGVPALDIGSCFRFFFPLNVRPMGADAYCLLGLSPMFRSVEMPADGKLDMGNVPFYQFEQEAGSGVITCREMKIEKQVIKKPTKEEIKKYGKQR